MNYTYDVCQFNMLLELNKLNKNETSLFQFKRDFKNSLSLNTVHIYREIRSHGGPLEGVSLFVPDKGKKIYKSRPTWGNQAPGKFVQQFNASLCSSCVTRS